MNENFLSCHIVILSTHRGQWFIFSILSSFETFYIMIQGYFRRTINFVYENPKEFEKMDTIEHHYSLSSLIGQNDERALIWLYISS